MTTESLHNDHLVKQSKLQSSNKVVAIAVVFVVACMVGLSFAAVPLYAIFCQVTGYDGTTQRASAPADRVINTKVRVRFDANISSDLSWDFKPVQNTVDVKLGESKIIEYTAENTSNVVLTGTAKFKVIPEIAGSYFNKIACFCFTEQKLEPGQKVRMPVEFFVDPDMIDDPDAKGVQEITLSYTFIPVKTTLSKTSKKSDTKKANGS
ncbi:MAG: cytochrome c oxidase assembly protein [Methyloligellaceae bacterium]